MATKKTKATTEEAERTPSAATNCTDSVETAKGNQELAQEQNPATIENNGITEHQAETEAEIPPAFSVKF